MARGPIALHSSRSTEGAQTVRHAKKIADTKVAEMSTLLLDEARLAPDLEDVLGVPAYADDEELLAAVLMWQPNEELWQLLGHSDESATHLAAIAYKLAPRANWDCYRGVGGWLQILLAICFGCGMIAFLTYGLWLDVGQFVLGEYKDWERGSCHLQDFSGAGIFRDFTCASDTGQCFFDVKVVNANLIHEEWQLPFAKTFDDGVHQGGLTVAADPFRCCNSSSVEGCCAMYEPESLIFCDAWGGSAVDAEGNVCPLAPWNCLYKVVDTEDGVEVTALEVFEPPETLGYYVCSGVFCFVFLAVAFRDTRDRALRVVMRCLLWLRLGVLYIESLFRDTHLIKADTSNTLDEARDRKQEHNKRKLRQSNVLQSLAMGRKNTTASSSPTLQRGMSMSPTMQRGMSRALSRSLTRSGTRPLDASAAAKKDAIRHKLRQATMDSSQGHYGARMLRQGSRWSSAVGQEAFTAASKVYHKRLADRRAATQGSTTAWDEEDMDGNLASRRAAQVQAALRPIVTPLWRKRRHLKQKYGRDPLRHLAAQGESLQLADAVHGRDRQWLRQQEAASFQPAAPPRLEAPPPQMPGRPASDFVMAPQVREAWGEGSKFHASAAGHWASQAAIIGRHAAHAKKEHLGHDRRLGVGLSAGARLPVATEPVAAAGRAPRAALRYGGTVQLDPAASKWR
mmetsp:Transcript_56808/g.133410  ORF Transcript_56808/g.133410 Transcript_56808/m.133410 type:complete len:681 (-) Transcript_56808:126-2168(-)